jgi:putative ABC transport system permease protein
MTTLLQDLRYAFRSFRKNPGFALAAAATLALGIGAATTIFSVAFGVLVRPLPYPESRRIVEVSEVGRRGHRMNMADPNFRDLRQSNRSLSGLAEYASDSTPIEASGQVMRVSGAAVSADFFHVIGVAPNLGRSFSPEELHEGAAPVVVLSRAVWASLLGGSRDLGSLRLRIGSTAYTVVGVMPAGFDFPAGAGFWIPREQDPWLPSRTAHNWHVVGRLAPDASLERARDDLSAIARGLQKRFGEDTDMADVAVVPLREYLVGSVRPALLIELGAAIFLLLVALANVASIVLARSAVRRRELAVRIALGAGRGRLARQFITECSLLALAGGAVGVLLATWATALIRTFHPERLPRAGEIGVDFVVVAFAVAVALLAGAALGVIALARARTEEPNRGLRGAPGAFEEGGGKWLRGVPVAAQVAVTLVLLAGLGLLTRSLVRLLAVEPGFRVDRTVAMELFLPSGDGASPPSVRSGTHNAVLVGELIGRLSALPEVRSVGGVSSLPLLEDASNGTFLIVHGADEVTKIADFERLMRDPSRTGNAYYQEATEGYFRAMGIPLLRGRLFEERDAPDAPHVALISQSLARSRWPGADPVGRQVEFGNMDGNFRPLTIVGVVGDVHQRGLDAPAEPTIYVDYRQRPAASSLTLAIDCTGRAGPVIAAARQIEHEMAPGVPVKFLTVRDAVSASLASRKLALALLGIFAAVALLLSAIGISGSVGYAVTGRRREMGVRMALGASAGNIVRLVVGEGMQPVAVGLAAGAVIAAAATRVLRSLLFQVRPGDPAVFAAALLLAGLIALAASYLPARRATKVDPIEALRAE